MFMTWIIYLSICIHLYLSIFGGVRGHSIDNRQLLRVEPLQNIKFDIAPRPDKFFQKRNLTPNPAYRPIHPQSIEHDDILRLQFNVFNQSFYLHLEPNLDLFHPSAVTWYPHEQRAEPLTHDQFRVYRGHVVSDAHTHQRWQADCLGVKQLDYYNFYDGGRPAADDGILGWARVVLRQDLTSEYNEPVIEGTFEFEHDLYHIKTTENYKLTKRSDDAPPAAVAAPMAIYRDSDTVITTLSSSQTQGDCQFQKLAFNLDQTQQYMRVGHPLGILDTSSHALFGPSPGLQKRQSAAGGCPSTMKIAYMGAAADCSYTRAYGSVEKARAQIITDWNMASGIYQKTFNIQLGLINVTILPEACPTTPTDDNSWNRDCSDSYSISDRLSDFSLWRSYMSDDGAALWHLMTNCPTGAEVGVAWLRQLCNTDVSRQTNAGVTQYVSGTGVSSIMRDEWKVIAHEIGHGFGAIHDCTSYDCPCSGSSCACCQLSSTECNAGGTYIMNPTNNVSSNSFSPCSISTICGLYSTLGSCLEDPGSRTIQTLQQCGNGIKEEGEDCDPGSKESTCCDAETCKFIGSAVCDDATDGCCDKCQLRPANYVCRAPIGECDIEEICDGTSSACPIDQHVADGTTCGSNNSSLTCATGECTSRDLQCRQRGSELSITSACSSMSTSCSVVCQSASGSACTVFNGNFLDGTPCGSGGRCSNGSCGYGSTSDRALAWLKDHKEIAIPVGCAVAIILLLILSRCFFKGCCCSCWPGYSAYKTRRRMRQQGEMAPPTGAAGAAAGAAVPHAAGAVPMQRYYAPPSGPPPPLPPFSRPASSGSPQRGSLQNAPNHWVDPSAYNGPSGPSFPPPIYAPPPTAVTPHSRANLQHSPPPPPAHDSEGGNRTGT